MATPPIPPPLEQLGARPFAFYPAILNVDHNEWIFRKATWSEILVANAKTGSEIWIPRRFVGEVSRIDDPIVIVGLNRELEYKGGTVWPYQRRVIEMPVAVGGLPTSQPPPPDRGAPAPIVGIRLESPTDRRIVRLIIAALGFAFVAWMVVVNLNRVGELRQRNIQFTARDEAYLELSGRDGYLAVIQKLGRPATDRWQGPGGEIQYRALGYPDRKYTVILMGGERNAATYVGTVDDNWRPVHSVPLPSGGTTSSLLRNLKRF